MGNAPPLTGIGSLAFRTSFQRDFASKQAEALSPLLSEGKQGALPPTHAH